MGKQTKNLNSALVLFSGGQDSTTCLAWAQKKFAKVHAISFDYGQRHSRELTAARKICKICKVPLKIVKIDLFKQFSKNALTHKNVKITAGKGKNLPSTFVPGRNLIFLSIASVHAYQLKVTNLITGVCQTDFSGYPDCRADFIKSLEKSLNLAMEQKFKIFTPLMHLTKAETVKLMSKLKQIELLKYSHTCYKGNALACGKCPACLLRIKGFKEAKIKDPIKYQS